MTETDGLDATAMAELVRKGEVTPLELTEQAIARAEKIDPTINAIVHPRFERAREEAAAHGKNGPLCGVPFVVKDMRAPAAGEPQQEGNVLLKKLDHRADHDCYLVEKCRSAGLVTIGRTNVPEFASGADCEPHAFGPTRNPWNPDYATLGSSGGSAAAVAAGIVPMAHGTDGGGSVRIPSSACGVVGLKPSRGLISCGPDAGEFWAGFSTSGVHSRSVRDAAAGLLAMAGPMPGDPYSCRPPAADLTQQLKRAPGALRIGLADPSQSPEIHPDCAAAVEAAAALLEQLGHRIEISQPAPLGEEEFGLHFFRVVASHVAAGVADFARVIDRDFGPNDVEPITWFWLEHGRSLSAGDYIESRQWLAGYGRRIAQWWQEGFDLLLTPTMACPPPRLGIVNDPDRVADVTPALVRFTAAFNVTGQPAVSLPFAWTDDALPVGIQLVGPYGREDLLLRLAAQVEEGRPWRGRRPALFAA